MNTIELEQIYTQLAQAIQNITEQSGEQRTPLFLATLSLNALAQLDFSHAQRMIAHAQNLAQS